MKYKGIAVSGFSQAKFNYKFNKDTMSRYHRMVIHKWTSGCLAVFFAIACVSLLVMTCSEVLMVTVGLFSAFGSLIIAGVLCFDVSTLEQSLALKLALLKTSEYKDFLIQLHDVFEKRIQDSVVTYNKTQGEYQQILIREGIASLAVEEQIQQILETIKEFRDEQKEIRYMIEQCDKINSSEKWEREYAKTRARDGGRWYVSFKVLEEK